MLSRRHFLTAAGVTLALPMLEAMQPRSVRGAEEAKAPQRMVAICTPLGIHTPNLFPAKAGKDYESTPYLDVLKDFRNDLSVISGLSHPGIDNSHDSGFSFLTAVPHPERRAGFRNEISLDQLAAEKIGPETRFPSLCLAAEGFGLSWTRSGAPVPCDGSPSRVFARLFLDGRPDEVAAQVQRLQDGRSVLDSVGDQARRMQANLGIGDREKLEEYFGSVRELEKRMAMAEEWSKKPKPKVEIKSMQDATNPNDIVGKSRLFFDLTHLALQTDSTRLITIQLLGSSNAPPIPGVNDGHHNLSHHGQDPDKLKQLRIIEEEKLKTFAALLGKLKETKEGGKTLLDHTSVYFSSNLGNASNHSCKNLPVILAGGGFKHGQHLAFDPEKNPPLSNLYVSLLQNLGLEIDKFGTSTGTLTGIT